MLREAQQIRFPKSSMLSSLKKETDKTTLKKDCANTPYLPTT